MSRVDIYEYPPLMRIVARVAPLGVLFVIGFLLALPWLDDELVVEPVRYGVISLLAVPAALAFAAAIHLMYPAVHAGEGTFRLVTPLYKSGWIPYGAIRSIRTPDTRLVTQIISVTVPGIHPMYWLIGLSQGILGPAFLIHPNLQNGGRLLRTLLKRRPDLFPEAGPS